MPGFSKKDTEYRAINTLNAFPPQNIPPDELAHALRTAMPDKSHYEEGMVKIDFNPRHDYYPQLPDELKREIAEIDQDIYALMKGGDSQGVKDALKKRAELLYDETEKAFKGGFFEEPDKPTLQGEAEGMVGATLGLLGLYADMFKGEPLKDMEDLDRRGVNVIILVPEYDLLGSATKAKEFFKDNAAKAQTNVQIQEAAGHASFAINPSMLEDTQKHNL